MSGKQDTNYLYKQQDTKMIRRALAIIRKQATKGDANKALKAAGVTGGLNLQCWVAYNHLPA